jgi:hypothetical protein
MTISCTPTGSRACTSARPVATVAAPIPQVAVHPDGRLGTVATTPTVDGRRRVELLTSRDGVRWSRRPLTADFAPLKEPGSYAETTSTPHGFLGVFLQPSGRPPSDVYAMAPTR